VSTPTGAPPSGLAPGGDGHVWHTLSAERALQTEGAASIVVVSEIRKALRRRRSASSGGHDVALAEPSVTSE
jgi:hypothetical protein